MMMKKGLIDRLAAVPTMCPLEGPRQQGSSMRRIKGQATGTTAANYGRFPKEIWRAAAPKSALHSHHPKLKKMLRICRGLPLPFRASRLSYQFVSS
jgi:hypothetical protein